MVGMLLGVSHFTQKSCKREFNHFCLERLIPYSNEYLSIQTGIDTYRDDVVTTGATLASPSSPWSAACPAASQRVPGGTVKVPAEALIATARERNDARSDFAGGFVREVNKGITSGLAAYRGDDVPTNKIPLIGRFYGNAEGPNAVKTAYFENVKRLNGHEAEIKGRAKNGGDVVGYMARNPEAGFAIPANREINAIANMQRSRRQMEEQGIPRERLRALDEQIAERMKLESSTTRTRITGSPPADRSTRSPTLRRALRRPSARARRRRAPSPDHRERPASTRSP